MAKNWRKISTITPQKSYLNFIPIKLCQEVFVDVYGSILTRQGYEKSIFIGSWVKRMQNKLPKIEEKKPKKSQYLSKSNYSMGSCWMYMEVY